MHSSVHQYLLPAVLLISFLSAPYTAGAQSSPNGGQGLPHRSAFHISLGANYTSVDFGSQDIIAIGTSTVTDASGATLATGYADGPDDATGGTPIDMDALLGFAPSIEVGYSRYFSGSDRWLWGAAMTNDYLGMTSHSPTPRLPQVGTFTPVGAPNAVPFTGNAVAISTHTEVVDQVAFRPFLGQSFGGGFVYIGGGPTVAFVRSDVRKLVGFADINGNRSNISGAPQDFSSSAWVWGGSGQIGTTYFLDSGLFLDFRFTYSMTRDHTFDYSSTFSNTDVGGTTNAGTLVGSSTWRAITQGFGVKIGRTF